MSPKASWQCASGLVEVGARVVQPGDRDGAGHADRGALLPQRGGGGVHAVDRGDDEQGGVGGAQAGAQLTDEVGVAGGVQQVDLDALVQSGAQERLTERCCRTAAGSWSETVVPSVTEPARLIVPVAASSASTSVVFPAPEWPDQHHVAYLAGVVHHRRWCRRPPSPASSAPCARLPVVAGVTTLCDESHARPAVGRSHTRER